MDSRVIIMQIYKASPSNSTRVRIIVSHAKIVHRKMGLLESERRRQQQEAADKQFEGKTSNTIHFVYL
jgi:hypothetical protein